MNIPYLLILLSLLLAAPGLWLLRQDSHLSTAISALLLLVATAIGYFGVRLWLDPTQPPPPSFAYTAAPGHFQVVSPAALPDALAQSRGRPVLIEFYADWCSSCQVWKNTVFSRQDVQTAMQPLVLLQIDATELTPEVQALLGQYQLAGLPAILVYDPSGKERPELRLLGEMSAPDFIRWLQSQLLPAM